MFYHRKHEKNNKNGLSSSLNIFATLLAAKCKSKLEQCHMLIRSDWMCRELSYSGIFYSCQFIKSFRLFHSFLEEEDLSREINTNFNTEWHHYHDYPVSGSSSQQCHGIPLKVSCLFSSIFDHYTNFSRQSVIKVSNQYRTHMTFSHKTQVKIFTWPNMSFYAR